MYCLSTIVADFQWRLIIGGLLYLTQAQQLKGISRRLIEAVPVRTPPKLLVIGRVVIFNMDLAGGPLLLKLILGSYSVDFNT